MTGKYKDFYKFIQCFNPKLCNLWEDFNNRNDPSEGDKFLVSFNGHSIELIFDKVIFDKDFNNGVAFYYCFHDENNDKYEIRSINDVYNPNSLTLNDIDDLYKFWTSCIPIK